MKKSFKRESLPTTLRLDGLELGGAQQWGGARLVSVLRLEPSPEGPETAKSKFNDFACRPEGPETAKSELKDLRIDMEALRGSRGAPTSVRTANGIYTAIVPHGMVASWTNDGSPVVAYGTQVSGAKNGRPKGLVSRLPKGAGTERLRFLPMHLAMEGLLALHFGGPEIAWSEYLHSALRDGLGTRRETVVPGRRIRGLEDALRVFEIHERQVGVLIFLGDELASAFVVPHPDDYRALHPTLITEFYGELFAHHQDRGVASLVSAVDETRVSTLADLRREIHALRTAERAFLAQMAEGITMAPVRTEVAYRGGSFTLARFLPHVAPTPSGAAPPALAHHVGEYIRRTTGELAYLRTFRLSRAQMRRIFLLETLATHQWNLAHTALALRQPLEDLVKRMDEAGIGYLLKHHVRESTRHQ